MPPVQEIDASNVINEALEKGERIWKRRIGIAERAYRHTHNLKSMPDNLKAALINCYTNTFEEFISNGLLPRGSRMHEDTFSANVSPHVPYAFDVITALIPNLIIDEIASIQPMDRRTGEIYYMDYRRGIAKGKHTANEEALNALSGAYNDGQSYDGEYSTDDETQQMSGTVNSSNRTFTLNVGYTPIVTGSVNITDGTQVITDDGEGNLIGDGTGTVDYNSGAISAVFAVAPTTGDEVDCTVQIDQEQNPDAVGMIDLELRADVVTARRHALRARWMMDAEYDLQKAHGKNAGDEILAVVVSEIKRDIEIRYMNMLWASATGAPRSFDANPPTIGITKFDHYRTFKVELNAAGNQIMQDTQRASGNFVICGVDVCTMLESLGEPDFKPMVDMMNPPAGPHLCGVLSNRWRIIKNPAPQWNGRALVGHKGEGYLNAGSIWAPYRPVVITPKVTLDDFKNRQGVLSYSAQKMINAKMFAQVTVTNTP